MCGARVMECCCEDAAVMRNGRRLERGVGVARELKERVLLCGRCSTLSIVSCSTGQLCITPNPMKTLMFVVTGVRGSR